MNDSASKLLLIVRGVICSLILGPLCLIGGAFAALALLEFVIDGWRPSNWFNLGGPLDRMVGGGPGAFSAYVRFMIGAVIASASAGAIRWSFGRK